MDALILSCGTGGGHNSAGEAIEQSLFARGHRVTKLNPYLLKSEKTAQTVNNAYIRLVQKIPGAFGVAYRLGNAYRKLPISSPVYELNKLMAPLLEQYLTENRFDCIVTTHLFPAEIITNLKRKGKTVPPTYFIATDYTCIPFTEETDCDYYIIPAEELTDEFAARGIARKKIVPLGIPVKRQFYQTADKTELRRRLGLPLDKVCILIAGGSIGAGQIGEIIPLLSEHYKGRARLVVVCGKNQELHRSLSESFGGQCEVMEFTNQMADYVRACDIFLSKPGGLSSTEAAVVGTALVHITPIPGCENRNMDFFVQNGMSLAVTAPQTQLLDACDSLMNVAAREKMIENQHRVIPRDASIAICAFIEKRIKTESV